MKIFKTSFLVLLIAIVFNSKSYGQQHIKGPVAANERATPLTDELLEEFKARTTVFVVRNDDDATFLEEEIQQFWTINDIIVLNYDEVDIDFNDQDYAFFEIQGKFTTKQKPGSSLVITCSYVHLILHFTTLNEEGEEYKESIASTVLHPDIKTLLAMEGYSEEDNEFTEHIYNDASIYNWNELMLINFAQLVNKRLEAREGRASNLKMYDNERLKVLTTETLYVPEYVLRKYSPIKYSEDNFYVPEKLFASYKYNYEVISTEDLIEKYLNAAEPFYYLTSMKHCNRMFFNVVDGLTGEIIYADEREASYKIKTGDIRYLNSKIE